MVIAMGLKVRNTINYELGNNLTEFFEVPTEVPNEDVNIYDDIKDKIYELYLDVEEKAEILNTISKYKTTNSMKEKKQLKAKIDQFIKEYNL